MTDLSHDDASEAAVGSPFEYGDPVFFIGSEYTVASRNALSAGANNRLQMHGASVGGPRARCGAREPGNDI